MTNGSDHAAPGESDPSTPSAELSWITGWGWLALLPILPAIASLASAQAQGWIPVSDAAVAAVRAADVARLNVPLLGLPASISEFAGGAMRYHPGPFMFLSLAPFVWVFGTQTGAALGAVAINTAASVGAIRATHRAGRPRLTAAMTATVMMTAVTIWGPGHLYDPFNTMLPALMLLCTLVLAWRLACGDGDLLPWAVVAASFCVQTHAVYALPILVTLGPAAAVALGPPALRPPGTRRPTRNRLVTSALVALAVWTPPLIEAARNQGGNLRVLASGSSGAAILGPAGALAALNRLVDLPPTQLTAISDDTFLRATNVSLILVLGLAVYMASRTIRSGDPVLRRLLAVASAAALGSAATVALLPSSPLEGSQMTFFKVVTPFVWMALLAPPLDLWRPAPAKFRAARVGGVTALGIFTLAACLPFQIRNSYDQDSWLFDATPAIGDQLEQALEPGEDYRIEAFGGPQYLLLLYGVVADLDARGWQVGVTEKRLTNYGDERVMADRPGLITLVIQDPAMEQPPDSTLVAEFTSEEDAGARREFEAELLAMATEYGRVVLTPEATNQLGSTLLGRPGLDAAQVRSLQLDPSGLLDQPPEVLAALYRSDWVAEPTLSGEQRARATELLGPTPVKVWIRRDG